MLLTSGGVHWTHSEAEADRGKLKSIRNPLSLSHVRYPHHALNNMTLSNLEVYKCAGILDKCLVSCFIVVGRAHHELGKATSKLDLA